MRSVRACFAQHVFPVSLSAVAAAALQQTGVMVVMRLTEWPSVAGETAIMSWDGRSGGACQLLLWL